MTRSNSRLIKLTLSSPGLEPAPLALASHEADLDYGLAKAGFSYKHDAAEDSATILADLDRYSLVMCTPLVDLNVTFAGGEEAVRAWLERGNALAITDACYPNQFNPWLATLIPDSSLDICPCYGCETVTNLFVRDVVPTHPMRTLPERLEHECRQWQCLKAGAGWETVATCTGPAEIHPVTVLHPLGKGFVYVSSMQQRWSALAPNLRANLLLRRAGLAPVAYSLTPPAIGPGLLHLELKSLGKPAPVQFRLKLDSPSSAQNGAITPIVQPDKEGRIVADLRFALRVAGPARLSFEAQTTTSGWISLFDRAIDVPSALAVLPPRYRGLLSMERRTREVAFEVQRPGNGPKAGLVAAKVSVYDPKGQLLGTGVAESKTNVTALAVPVRLPRLAAGDGYRVKAVARSAAGTMDEASTNFVVRAPADHPGETIIDEDKTLLVDGKPFFPLGIYHLGPDAYPQVADLGFNTVLTIQWMTRNRESLDAAQKLGLKVVFENNEKELGGHSYLPGFLRDHPALLMWYAPDEPLHEADSKFAMDVTDIYRQGDPYHPVICVDFNPPRFALNSRCSDVFAPECYIFKKDGETPFWKAVDLVEVTRDAVQGRQPVFVDIRATGGERADDERVVAWLALTHDVRGLFWYSWDEGKENLGLKYDASLQDGIKNLLTQIRELTPALTATVRRPFVAGDVHGIVCDDGETRTLLIVNKSRQATAMPVIPEFKGLAPEPLFGAPAITASLSPLETRAYRCRIRPAAGGLQSARK